MPHIGLRVGLPRTYFDGRIKVLIPSLCKSAGTLVAVGAHELVIADRGELGPLDVQLRKPDELLERMSGLDVNEALTSLQARAFEAFEQYLLDLNLRSGGGISLKTAMQIATDLTVGLFEPIYGQIDPMRMGEIAREIRIADEYGQRLNSTAKNLKDGALERLVAKYPSHTFVIDRDEAKGLFHNVPSCSSLTCVSLNSSNSKGTGNDFSVFSRRSWVSLLPWNYGGKLEPGLEVAGSRKHVRIIVTVLGQEQMPPIL